MSQFICFSAFDDCCQLKDGLPLFQILQRCLDCTAVLLMPLHQWALWSIVPCSSYMVSNVSAARLLRWNRAHCEVDCGGDNWRVFHCWEAVLVENWMWVPCLVMICASHFLLRACSLFVVMLGSSWWRQTSRLGSRPPSAACALPALLFPGSIRRFQDSKMQPCLGVASCIV